MKEQVLIYSQDVGGAKYIIPSINQIVSRYPSLVVIHPLSEQVFKKHKIAFYPLVRFFGHVPIQEKEIGAFLLENKVSHLYCTTSSPYLDLTNSRLINASRKLNIPTFGIMDHWKGFDRFLDSNGEISYFPDYVGCIDEACKRKLIKFCKNSERVFVVGHPHLEEILNKRGPTNEKNTVVNILIISQPNTKDRSFHSIFLKKIDSETLIEKIVKQIRKGVDININYRAHPKEQASLHLPDGVVVNKEEDWQDALRNNDIFIGLDSMLLIEAGLAGKYCISIRIPKLLSFIDAIIPYKIGEEVGNIDSLGNTITKAVKMVQGGKHHEHSGLEETVRGSLKRLVHSFETFININKPVSLK